MVREPAQLALHEAARALHGRAIGGVDGELVVERGEADPAQAGTRVAPRNVLRSVRLPLNLRRARLTELPEQRRNSSPDCECGSACHVSKVVMGDAWRAAPWDMRCHPPFACVAVRDSSAG